MVRDISRPALLLVHGAWHGSWCWDTLRPVLAAGGWPTHAVDLPSAGGLAGVQDDAQAVLRERNGIDGPAVVVAHSYGGIPVSQAVADTETSGVTHIVYLAAYQLDIGQSLLGYHGAPVPQQDYQAVPTDPIRMFYADVPLAQAQHAAGRLVPQSTRSFSDTLTQAGWHSVPSTYIVCGRDRILPPQVQQTLAARSGAVHHLASSHSPFLSMPQQLADLLAKIVLEAIGRTV